MLSAIATLFHMSVRKTRGKCALDRRVAAAFDGAFPSFRTLLPALCSNNDVWIRVYCVSILYTPDKF